MGEDEEERQKEDDIQRRLRDAHRSRVLATVPPDFLSRVVWWTDYATYTPKEYRVAAAYAAMAALLDKKVCYYESLTAIYPNLFTLLVEEILKGVGGIPVLKIGKMTPEGLARELKKNSHSHLYCPELGALIHKGEYQGHMPEMLCDLYDCPDIWNKTLAQKTEPITDPYVNLAIGVQPESLMAAIDEKLIRTGLLARFWIVGGEKLRRRRTGPWPVLRLLAVEAAKKVIAHIADSGGKLNFLPSQSFSRLLNAYVGRLTGLYSMGGERAYEKAAGILIRLACLNAVNRLVFFGGGTNSPLKDWSFAVQMVKNRRIPTQRVGAAESVGMSLIKSQEKEGGMDSINNMSVVDVCVSSVMSLLNNILYHTESRVYEGGFPTPTPRFAGSVDEKPDTSTSYVSVPTASIPHSVPLPPSEDDEEEGDLSKDDLIENGVTGPIYYLTAADLAGAVFLMEWMRPTVERQVIPALEGRTNRARAQLETAIRRLVEHGQTVEIRGMVCVSRRLICRCADVDIDTFEKKHLPLLREANLLGDLVKYGRREQGIAYVVGDGKPDTSERKRKIWKSEV